LKARQSTRRRRSTARLDTRRVTVLLPLLVREIQAEDLADVRAGRDKAPGLERPIVVGDSIAAAAAGLYAATYPARGIGIIDQATERLGAFIEHCNRPSNGA
jgi:pimeloyl-ACP methyl ester carboxylesterase